MHIFWLVGVLVFPSNLQFRIKRTIFQVISVILLFKMDLTLLSRPTDCKALQITAGVSEPCI